jgi:hypothetical protein
MTDSGDLPGLRSSLRYIAGRRSDTEGACAANDQTIQNTVKNLLFASPMLERFDLEDRLIKEITKQLSEFDVGEGVTPQRTYKSIAAKAKVNQSVEQGMPVWLAEPVINLGRKMGLAELITTLLQYAAKMGRYIASKLSDFKKFVIPGHVIANAHQLLSHLSAVNNVVDPLRKKFAGFISRFGFVRKVIAYDSTKAVVKIVEGILSFVWTILLAVAEEKIKDYSLLLRFSIDLFETACMLINWACDGQNAGVNLLHQSSAEHLIGIIFVKVLHLMLALAPLPLRMVIHALWNLVSRMPVLSPQLRTLMTEDTTFAYVPILTRMYEEF